MFYALNIFVVILFFLVRLQTCTQRNVKIDFRKGLHSMIRTFQSDFPKMNVINLSASITTLILVYFPQKSRKIHFLKSVFFINFTLINEKLVTFRYENAFLSGHDIVVNLLNSL